MAYTERELAEIGSRFNRERLIREGSRLAGQAQDDGIRLPANFISRVTTKIAEVQTLGSDQETAKHEAPLATVAQGEAFADLKVWVADAIEAGDNAFEDDPNTRDRFHTSGKIGRSVTRLLGAADNLIGLVTKSEDIANAIAEWHFDATRVAEGETKVAALRDADAKQEGILKNLPTKTFALQVAKGRLYLDLKRIARRGRNTFKNDPARGRVYVLDVKPPSRGTKQASTDSTSAT